MPPKGERHYSMQIEWDAEDGIYVVTVPELPGCRTHGRTYGEAVDKGEAAIESWIAAAQADGDTVPPPRLAPNYAAAAPIQEPDVGSPTRAVLRTGAGR